MTDRYYDALTVAERHLLWTRVDHAVADARAGHRHTVGVDHDVLRRLLRAHDRLHDSRQRVSTYGAEAAAVDDQLVLALGYAEQTDRPIFAMHARRNHAVLCRALFNADDHRRRR